MPNISQLLAIVTHQLISQYLKSLHVWHVQNLALKFSLIKKKYIDTGEVSFTLIPVCFIRGSMPAAQALLCVYHHDPREPDIEAYVEYFHRLLVYPKEEGKNWATPQVLTKLTENLKTHSGCSINPKGLMQCIDSQRYEEQIKKITFMALRFLEGS